MAEPESKVAVVGSRRARDKAAIDEIRVPPHSVEAEQAVLGALMLDNRAWDTIADRIVADDFYRRDHQLIFEAIAELAGRSEPSDAVTLSEWLGRKGVSEETGGLVYLAGLVRDTPSAANVRAYADAVRERSTLRRLITVGGEIASSAFDPDGRAATELVDEAERRVFEIAEAGNKTRSGFVPLKDELGPVIDRLDLLQQNKGVLPGLGTGFPRLDEMTAGLQKGDLIVIAGRPSMGKTTFAINIAENAAFGPAQGESRRFQHGNVARAGRVPHDFLVGTRGSKPSASRQHSGRRLESHQQRDSDDEDRRYLHRRYRIVDSDRRARACASPEA